MAKQKLTQRLSKWLYNKVLPIYIPKDTKVRFAIWCCIDCRRSGDLWEVLKGTRITLRKDGCAIWVIKKGEV